MEYKSLYVGEETEDSERDSGRGKESRTGVYANNRCMPAKNMLVTERYLSKKS